MEVNGVKVFFHWSVLLIGALILLGAMEDPRIAFTVLFSDPYSRYDHCVIAWGGVAAQAIVAVPLIAWVEIFGYTRFPPVNAALAILGFFSLSTGAFNLLPIRPLDGSIAWRLLPALLKRRPTRPIKREPAWRSWR